MHITSQSTQRHVNCYGFSPRRLPECASAAAGNPCAVSCCEGDVAAARDKYSLVSAAGVFGAAELEDKHDMVAAVGSYLTEII